MLFVRKKKAQIQTFLDAVGVRPETACRKEAADISAGRIHVVGSLRYECLRFIRWSDSARTRTRWTVRQMKAEGSLLHISNLRQYTKTFFIHDKTFSTVLCLRC